MTEQNVVLTQLSGLMKIFFFCGTKLLMWWQNSFDDFSWFSMTIFLMNQYSDDERLMLMKHNFYFMTLSIFYDGW